MQHRWRGGVVQGGSEGKPSVIAEIKVAGINNERKGGGESAHRWRDEQV